MTPSGSAARPVRVAALESDDEDDDTAETESAPGKPSGGIGIGVSDAQGGGDRGDRILQIQSVDQIEGAVHVDLAEVIDEP